MFGYPKTVRTTLSRYFFDKIHPQKRRARQLIEDIEKATEQKPGTLTLLAFKEPEMIRRGSNTPVPYRENLRVLTKLPFRLKDLPIQILIVWDQLVAWHSGDTVRVGDEIEIREPGTYWARTATVEKVRQDLLRFYGFLALPCIPTSTVDGVDPKGVRGKGMSMEQLSIAQLFDTSLLMDYFGFLRARNAEQKYTVSARNLVATICAWVNKPSSFFNAHRELSAQFGLSQVSPEKWAAYLHKVHQKLLRLNRSLRKAVKGKSRDPNAPLRTVFEDPNPYSLVLEMTARMEADLSPRTQKQSYATGFRDLVIVRMLAEVPLHAKNTVELEVGPNLIFDKKNLIWTIYVPKCELKNHTSKHAEDIHRQYSQETSALMTLYWEQVRPQLRNPQESNVFFLPTTRNKGRRTKEIGRAGLSRADLYMVISKYFKRYFGMGIGSNAFRHLLATSILREDSNRVATAAAVLNNGEAAIRQAYSHIKQKDELRWADNWRQDRVREFNSRPKK
jgi:hypothetical protein